MNKLIYFLLAYPCQSLTFPQIVRHLAQQSSWLWICHDLRYLCFFYILLLLCFVIPFIHIHIMRSSSPSRKYFSFPQLPARRFKIPLLPALHALSNFLWDYSYDQPLELCNWLWTIWGHGFNLIYLSCFSSSCILWNIVGYICIYWLLKECINWTSDVEVLLYS